MIFSLGPNQVMLQRGKDLLSLHQRQPNHPGRVFARGFATADLMGANCSIRSDQFHHDPPLHLVLPVATTGRSYHPQVLDGLMRTRRPVG
jgi:hypothetical protein